MEKKPDMEFFALQVHIELAQLHKWAEKYNKIVGNPGLATYHRMISRFESALALRHFKAYRKDNGK